MAVADSEYYDNLDKALKLLASADAQRSTTNSTAGEAMRFYNQFRDSRLSEQPTLVDTQSLLNNLKETAAPGNNNWAVYSKYKDDYYGGSNIPLRVASDNQIFGDDVRFPNGNFTGSARVTETIREPFAEVPVKDIWYLPDQSYAGIGQSSNDKLPDYFMTIPSGLTETLTPTGLTPDDPEYDSVPRFPYTYSDYNTNIELTPEQFDQLQMSMRASLPFPLQLQLLANSYAADNFRLNNTIENAIQTTNPETGSDIRLSNINFIDRDTDSYFSNPPISDPLLRFANWVGQPQYWAMNTTPVQAFAEDKSIYFPMDTAQLKPNTGFISGLIDQSPHTFPDLFAHEYGHMQGSGSDPEYIQAMIDDASVERPGRLDYDAQENSFSPLGEEKDSPYISAYGFQRDYPLERLLAGEKGDMHEEFADAFMMWLRDKQTGNTARGENFLQMNTGDYYTFADLYPNRAAYFDRLFGYAE